MAAFNRYYRNTYYCTNGKLVDNYIYRVDNNTTGGYSTKHKLPTNKYKKLCEELERDVKELKK